MKAVELRSTLRELGYTIDMQGVEQAFLDGVVTESESVLVADTLSGGQEPEPVKRVERAKFPQAVVHHVNRTTLHAWDRTEDEVLRRFFGAFGVLPWYVHRVDDGYVALGVRNGEFRRTHAVKKARHHQPVQLRGGLAA